MNIKKNEDIIKLENESFNKLKSINKKKNFKIQKVHLHL